MTTRSKRASSCGILLPFLLHLVSPDGTLAQGDRQHIAWSYSGIAAAAAAAATPAVTGVDAVSLLSTSVDAVAGGATSVDAVAILSTSVDAVKP